MNYRKNDAAIKAMCESRGIATDVVDFEAEWDSTLTRKENYAHLESILNELAEKKPECREPTAKEVLEEEQRLNHQQNLDLEEATKLAEDEAIKAIKNSAASEADQYFLGVKDYVRLIAQRRANAAIFSGRGGLGKTHYALKTLAEEGLTLGQDYEVLNTHITPLGFYTYLYRNQDKILVLDDCDGMLESPEIVGLLKSACWSATGKRVVNWVSSRDLDVPDRFEFKGGLIILLNDLPKNKSVEALISRAFFKEVDFSHDDLVKILYEVAKNAGNEESRNLTENERLEVADYLRETTDETVQDLNLRTLFKTFTLRKAYAENGKWKELAKEMLKPDDDLIAVKEVVREFPIVADQIKEFIKRTGLSRRTFFRLKKKIKR